jgi:hypothetical protein
MHQRVRILRFLEANQMPGGRRVLQAVRPAQRILRLPQEIFPIRILPQRVLESVTSLRQCVHRL